MNAARHPLSMLHPLLLQRLAAQASPIRFPIGFAQPQPQLPINFAQQPQPQAQIVPFPFGPQFTPPPIQSSILGSAPSYSPPPYPVAPPPSPPPPSAQPITQWDDNAAMQVLQLWRQMFTDAAPLPGLGMPSQNNGVLTFTHTMSLPGMPPPPPMTINGLATKSPLGNNALGSMEVSDGKWLLLYETMLPDVPGANGADSSVQRYVNALQRQNVSVGGNHYHWSGGQMMGHFALAIHSQTTGTLDPVTFTQAHLAAFRDFLSALPQNALHAR